MASLKKIKNLSINDIIYVLSDKNSRHFLSEKDYYGRKLNYSVVEHHIISSLSIDEKNERLLINRYSVYSSTSYLLKVPIIECSKSKYKESNGSIWFVDKSEYHKIIKEKVLEEIQNTETKIKVKI